MANLILSLDFQFMASLHYPRLIHFAQIFFTVLSPEQEVSILCKVKTCPSNTIPGFH